VTTTGKSRLRRVVFSILRIVLVSYIGVVMLLFLFQSRLVFVPSRTVDATPTDAGLRYEEVWFNATDGVKLNGWYVPAEQPRATVLLCHGNAGNISDRLDLLHVMNRMGLNAFIFDYRGYGRSEGKPTEKGTYADAEGAWRWLTEEKKIPAEQIILAGHSLGGPIAAWVAREHRPGGLVLEGSFTSMLDLARGMYPWLPVRWLLRFRYDTAEYVSGVTCPLLVVHSREDETVPFELGRRLYEGAPEPKWFLELTGTHDDGFETSGKVYTEGWERFLDQVPGAQREKGETRDGE